jgi:hypothetical protein
VYDGFVLGFLTWLSYCFSFAHLPKAIKVLLLKNFFVTDIISIIITFVLLTGISQSVTSVIASITCGLLVNLTLIIRNIFIPQ